MKQRRKTPHGTILSENEWQGQLPSESDTYTATDSAIETNDAIEETPVVKKIKTEELDIARSPLPAEVSDPEVMETNSDTEPENSNYYQCGYCRALFESVEEAEEHAVGQGPTWSKKDHFLAEEKRPSDGIRNFVMSFMNANLLPLALPLEKGDRRLGGFADESLTTKDALRLANAEIDQKTRMRKMYAITDIGDDWVPSYELTRLRNRVARRKQPEDGAKIINSAIRDVQQLLKIVEELKKGTICNPSEDLRLNKLPVPQTGDEPGCSVKTEIIDISDNDEDDCYNKDTDEEP